MSNCGWFCYLNLPDWWKLWSFVNMSDFKVASQVYLNQKLWERNCTPKEETAAQRDPITSWSPQWEQSQEETRSSSPLLYSNSALGISARLFDSLFSTTVYLLRFPEPRRFLWSFKNATLGHKLRQWTRQTCMWPDWSRRGSGAYTASLYGWKIKGTFPVQADSHAQFLSAASQ